MMGRVRTIESTVDVAAPPAVVRQILIGFALYEQWNPFITSASGTAEAGSTLTLHVVPPGDRGRTHHPAVLVAEPGERLVWLSKLPVPGAFSARHEFLLEAHDGGTRLVQRETFAGFVVPLLRRTLDRTEQGLADFNAALKARAEASA